MHRYYIYIISLPSMSNPSESLPNLSNYWHLYHYCYKHTHTHLLSSFSVAYMSMCSVLFACVWVKYQEANLWRRLNAFLSATIDWLSSSSSGGELLDFFYSRWHLTWSCQYVGLSEETILLGFHGYSIPVMSRRHWQQISWSSVSWYLPDPHLPCYILSLRWRSSLH